MPSVINYAGEKNALAPTLKLLVPPHRVYVEPFGGAANLLLVKPPSPIEVYNDINPDLVNLFTVLSDREKFFRWLHLLLLTLYSREEFGTLLQAPSLTTPEEKAWRTFVTYRQSFGGIGGGSWGFCVADSVMGMSGGPYRWLVGLTILPRHAKRCRNLIILNKDFREVLQEWDSPDTFFYCDPPYIHETVTANYYGDYDMSLQDHQDLVQMLLNCRGKVMLSGYQHETYEPLERAGWWRLDIPTTCSMTGRTRTGKLPKGWSAIQHQPRTESVWLNYPPPTIPPKAFVAVAPQRKGER